MIMPKSAVLALSRAIEDEYCAHAADGLLVGSFQEERFYRRSERRWRELGRTAEIAVVLADFPQLNTPPDAPIEVPIAGRRPLSREWSVVISAAGSQACLAAWEQPSQDELPDPLRRFEVLWSFDPGVVADAVQVTSELLEPIAPDLARRIAAHDVAPERPEPALRYGSSLTQRMVGYLGQMLDGTTSGN